MKDKEILEKLKKIERKIKADKKKKSKGIYSKLPKPPKVLKKAKRGITIVNVPQTYIPKGNRNTMKSTIEEEKKNFFFN